MKFKINFTQAITGIIVPLLVIGSGLAGYFLLLPKYKEMRFSREALESKKALDARTASQLSNIQNLVADLAQKKKDLKPIDEALPAAPRIPELLANLDYLVKQSGLLLGDLQVATAPSLATLAPGQKVSKVERLEALVKATEDLGVMQVDLKVFGQYQNLKSFLLNVEQNLRLMDIQSMVFGSLSEELKLQEYSVRLGTYYQKK